MVGLVFGIAFLLLPRLSLRLYGLDPDADPTAAYPLRYLGARPLLLAALMADETAAPRLEGRHRQGRTTGRRPAPSCRCEVQGAVTRGRHGG